MCFIYWMGMLVKMLLISGMIVMLILCVLLFAGSIVSYLSIFDKQKCTAYECGFDSFGSARIPFSLSFFLLALVFLVFDVEIVILFPLYMGYMWMPSLLSVLSVFLFLTILILGLFFEWSEGSLDWVSC